MTSFAAVAVACLLSADPARTVLEEAARALGPIPSAMVVSGLGRENLEAERQGLAPGTPTWRPHEETVAANVDSGRVAWERKTPRNDNSLRWRRFVLAPDGSGVVDWTTGRRSWQPDTIAARDRHAYMRRIPHLLLRDAIAAPSIERLDDQQIDGRPHDVVRVQFDERAPVTLLFSRAPVLLRRLEYAIDVPGLGSTRVRWEWSGWRRETKLGWVPAGHHVFVGDVPFQEVAYTRYEAVDGGELMQVPETAVARIPAESGAPAVTAAELPAEGEVAPGVHIHRVRGFVAMVVELPTFAVLVEAPESHPGLEVIPAAPDTSVRSVGKQLAELVAKTTKPLRYVVASHHHGDHMGGLPDVVGEGVTVLVAPGLGDAAKRALQGRPAAIEVVDGVRRIVDGPRVIEIHSVGKNPHTDENLMTWLPAERIAFQGDLFYYNEGAPYPPSGRATMNGFFAGWLRARGLDPKAIYGVHNRGAARFTR